METNEKIEKENAKSEIRNETRSLICSFLGHVDHGKSSVLDKIRGTCIIKSEAGAITQAIGASLVPLNTIKTICGSMFNSFKDSMKIPGLLFIDTPGHAAFTNLRKRGGNLADIAVVVIDINEGVMPQTEEAIEILKTYKTPFVIALNKIDLFPGLSKYNVLDRGSGENQSVLAHINSNSHQITAGFETKLYEVVGKLSEMGLQSERFDRVQDYTQQVAIVPVSAHTGEGIKELMMVLLGLAQKYLENSLKVNIKGQAKGTIMEVKEDKGLGTTIDVILYDGNLSVGDTILFGGMDKIYQTKIRGLFEPAPLAEMRDKKSKFNSVKNVKAAMGVKISAPELENAVAGMPIVSIYSTDSNKMEIQIEQEKERLMQEIEEVMINTDENGVIIKADSLGSLEALIKILKENEINVRKASIGNIMKKDVSDLQVNLEKDPLETVLLGFNVSLSKEVEDMKKEIEKRDLKIITSPVIYHILEEYNKWKKERLAKIEEEKLNKLTRPCKIQLIPQFIFRQNNPAVAGTDILVGVLKTGIRVMKNDGKSVGVIKGIQKDNEAISKAEQGKQVAVSYDGFSIGRQVQKDDILYSFIPENEFVKLKEFKKNLSKEEIEVLKDIAKIMRKNNPVWGVG